MNDDIPIFQDDKIIENEDINISDVQIKPNYYIHNALVNLQTALINPDVRAGFSQYVLIIEYMETICKSAKLLPDTYADQITQFKQEIEQAKRDDPEANKDLMVNMVKVANRKLEIMLTEVFANIVLTESVKL